MFGKLCTIFLKTKGDPKDMYMADIIGDSAEGSTLIAAGYQFKSKAECRT